MERVAGDRGLRGRLIERGLANVRRFSFSWDVCARTVMDAIERCI
jgi:hypothetical protein